MFSSGPLAHAWLEQRTHNPLVPCSTHGGPTTNTSRKKRLTCLGLSVFFIFLLRNFCFDPQNFLSYSRITRNFVPMRGHKRSSTLRRGNLHHHFITAPHRQRPWRIVAGQLRCADSGVFAGLYPGKGGIRFLLNFSDCGEARKTDYDK